MQFNLSGGAIQDQVGPVAVSQQVWNAEPIRPPAAAGAPPVLPFVTWSQQIQLTWIMTSSAPGLPMDNYAFTVPLGTLNWSLYKINAMQYVIE